MRYRKLSPSGDYVFGSGQNDMLINTPETVAQAVKTRLRLWLGEWFANTSDGTPWFEQVLGKYTAGVRAAVLRRRILSTPGVSQVNAFYSSYDGETRQLSVTVELVTIYGNVAVTEQLSGAGALPSVLTAR